MPFFITDAIGKAARKAGMVVSICVNERDVCILYNTQLLFEADCTLIQRRRKISPPPFRAHGLRPGRRVGPARRRQQGRPHWSVVCFEHNNPLARYTLIADGEETHSATYPGSAFG
ncbi:nitrilase-related carbon-nitrogen hydrolase [Undibacterium sp. TJN25]|uniref:nitrilase-related carbon-nitrogen hydrolase n=1 Tax=Undibacterium sp. TJN25 TaxID=3413056 RepID=UPI003BF359F5